MKRFLVLSSIFISMFTASVFAGSIASTNLDGVQIRSDATVIYKDGSKESFDNRDSMTVMFINGSIVKNSNIIFENNRTLVPLRVISETLGAKVDWNNAQRKVTITDSGNKVELIIANKQATSNGKTITLDAAPKIFDNYTYVPIRFVAEALNADVDFQEGKTGGGIFPNVRQVLVNRYPSDSKKITGGEANKILREQLIIAYETRYGTKYSDLGKNETVPQNATDRDAIWWRDFITNKINVKSQNDRFYITPVVFDFWIDVYTGEVYRFYNGIDMSLDKFNPKDKNALEFAG